MPLKWCVAAKYWSEGKTAAKINCGLTSKLVNQKIFLLFVFNLYQ
jgi:hypothetical protein